MKICIKALELFSRFTERWDYDRCIRESHDDANFKLYANFHIFQATGAYSMSQDWQLFNAASHCNIIMMRLRRTLPDLSQNSFQIIIL